MLGLQLDDVSPDLGNPDDIVADDDLLLASIFNQHISGPGDAKRTKTHLGENTITESHTRDAPPSGSLDAAAAALGNRAQSHADEASSQGVSHGDPLGLFQGSNDDPLGVFQGLFQDTPSQENDDETGKCVAEEELGTAHDSNEHISEDEKDFYVSDESPAHESIAAKLSERRTELEAVLVPRRRHHDSLPAEGHTWQRSQAESGEAQEDVANDEIRKLWEENKKLRNALQRLEQRVDAQNEVKEDIHAQNPNQGFFSRLMGAMTTSCNAGRNKARAACLTVEPPTGDSPGHDGSSSADGKYHAP